MKPEVSLIVPAAADLSEYDSKLPRMFSPAEDGILYCIKSVLGLNLQVFDHIYFTILRKHAEKYDIDSLLRLQFNRLGLDKAEIIILDTPTSTQAETIIRTIERTGIEGSIFIKDADSYFCGEIIPENGVAVYPLENLDIVDPKNKSYVAVDDMQYVTNIIEKRVISRYFNAGGYCFEDARDYIRAYQKYRGYGNIYLSHLIYAMLLDRHTFRPIKVTDYIDWNIPAHF